MTTVQTLAAGFQVRANTESTILSRNGLRVDQLSNDDQREMGFDVIRCAGCATFGLYKEGIGRPIDAVQIQTSRGQTADVKAAAEKELSAATFRAAHASDPAEQTKALANFPNQGADLSAPQRFLLTAASQQLTGAPGSEDSLAALMRAAVNPLKSIVDLPQTKELGQKVLETALQRGQLGALPAIINAFNLDPGIIREQATSRFMSAVAGGDADAAMDLRRFVAADLSARKELPAAVRSGITKLIEGGEFMKFTDLIKTEGLTSVSTQFLSSPEGSALMGSRIRSVVNDYVEILQKLPAGGLTRENAATMSNDDLDRLGSRMDAVQNLNFALGSANRAGARLDAATMKSLTEFGSSVIAAEIKRGAVEGTPQAYTQILNVLIQVDPSIRRSSEIRAAYEERVGILRSTPASESKVETLNRLFGR